MEISLFGFDISITIKRASTNPLDALDTKRVNELSSGLRNSNSYTGIKISRIRAVRQLLPSTSTLLVVALIVALLMRRRRISDARQRHERWRLGWGETNLPR